MIVRVAVLGALINVAEDAEAEFRILVQHLALGYVVGEVGRDEAVVLQHFPDQFADLLAAFDTRILFEDAPTLCRELLEPITHRYDLLAKPEVYPSSRVDLGPIVFCGRKGRKRSTS